VVYYTSTEYTSFVTGGEIITKNEGEVVAIDRARAITSASEQASDSLATLKYVREAAFEQKSAQAHQGP
jgi:hypothetical protein